MYKLAIILVIVIVFLIFAFVVLKTGNKSSSPAKDRVSVNVPPGSKLTITNDGNKAMKFEYSSFEDRPRAVDVFPELVEDLSVQEDILDRDFWESVSQFAELSPEEQEEIRIKLVAHGHIRYDDAFPKEMPAPVNENGEPIPVAPDPADEGQMDAYYEFMHKGFQPEF